MTRATCQIWALSAVALVATARAQPGAPAKAPVEAAAPAATAPSALSERLGWNARERTAAGVEALEKGDAATAQEALDTALRLRPTDPTARYNAGTGRLAAGDPSAAELLDQAARDASPGLAPSAWYNLGEARLGARDFRGAVEAFIETLKRRPDHGNAKHNLELALRELERQQQQQQKQQQEGGKGDQPQKENGEGDRKEPPQDDSGQGGDDRNREPEPSNPDPNGPPQQKQPDSLPQFRDLPDMTADQAAAILRAVENLERQQRQDRAENAAQAASTAVEIDW